MTFSEAYKSADIWQRKVVLVSLYHNARLAHNKKWKVTDTAKYFGISAGLCSENIRLSREYERVKDCESRNQALGKLK